MRQRSVLKTLLLSGVFLSLPVLAHAQAASDPRTTEVIVTVTREALPVSKVGQSVDVIDARTIQAWQSLFVADLLTHTADLSLTRNGGPGEAASASIRGAGADHTLYLLDGVPLNDPSQVGGGTNLGLLTTDDAARIEVLRGPLSTLWGSGALGGVVNITTHTPQKPLEGDLSLEGLDAYRSARLGIGGKSGGLGWRVFGSDLHDDGVSAFAGGSERDPFDQDQIGGKLSYDLDANTTVRALTSFSHSRNAYDGYPAPLYVFADTGDFGKTDTDLNLIALSNRFTNGEQTLSVSATDNKRHDWYDDGTGFIARGRIRLADYHVLYRLDGTRLLGGLSYERDEMTTASPAPWDPNPTPVSVHSTLSSAYGQVSHDFAGGATIAVSARHDDASSFGGQDIAQGSVSIPAGPWRFHASIGQGYKVPGLYQLYSDYGTATLKPEKALSADAGIDYALAGGQVTVTAFARHVRDLIDFGYDACAPSQLYGCYENIDRSEASGLELGLTKDWAQWHVRGNYSVLHTRNRSAGVDGKRLPHTPQGMSSVDVGYDATSRLTLGLGVRGVGQSFDNASNTVSLKAYTLVDLRADYRLSDALSLYGRIENAGDTRYQTAAGYGQPGRRLWLGIRARLF